MSCRDNATCTETSHLQIVLLAHLAALHIISLKKSATVDAFLVGGRR